MIYELLGVIASEELVALEVRVAAESQISHTANAGVDWPVGVHAWNAFMSECAVLRGGV